MSALSVTVVKGTNLINLETIGKSDPYTVIEFQGQKQKTKVIESNLNPEWNELLSFDLSGKPLASGDLLVVKVMDKEKIGPDRLMGTVDVPLNDLASGKTDIQLNLNLLDKNKRPTTGYLNLVLKYEPPKQQQTGGTAQVVGGQEGFDEEDGGDAVDSGEPGATSGGTSGPVRLKGTVGKRKGVKTYSTKPQDFQVRVKVIEGRKLQGGNISPVCKVSLKKQSKQTKVQASNDCPFWNASFFFNFFVSPAELFDEIVSFEVFNSKKLRSNALIGSFKFDLSMVYEEPKHAYINKWLLLSDPDDSTAGAKGYLKISIVVLGPGDEAPSFALIKDSSDDVESNVIRPAGVQLRPATFILKVYQAEDLPRMDSGALQGIKKIFTGTASKELVDPYMVVSFAGKQIMTSKKYTCDHPEWNEELRLALQFPSMCNNLKIQIFDWDRVGNDDAIGTIFLDISTIGNMKDQNGFLPTMGPCFLNFYGGPREYSDLPDKFEAINLGKGDGTAYRGRVLLELSTELNDTPELPQAVTPIKPDDVQKATKFLRRRKYKLHSAFLSATMIMESDDSIEFEVSMGNYGNKLDDSVPASSSCTQPTNAVFDGSHYYFLPWSNSKPCSVLDCQWEDISYRLFSINFFLRIADRLKDKISKIKVAVAARIPEEEQAQFVISALDDLIMSCSKPLPEWQVGQSPETELDKNLKALRECELKQIKTDAMKVREEATVVSLAVEELEGFLNQLNNLSQEPQNSMPDVVIWMLVGSKRRYYVRIPAYDLIWCENVDYRGRFSGDIQNLNLKLPILLEEKDIKDLMIPCKLRLKLWLGQAKEEKAWHLMQKEGKLTVMAETYENQASILGKWTSKSPLMTRPAWSDDSGKIALTKERINPPPGWSWDGDWFISPEMSLYFDKNALLTEYLEDVFACETRIPGGSWGPATQKYTNVKGDPYPAPNEMQLPEGWDWKDEWKIDFNRPCDEEGWEYAVEPSIGGYQPAEKMYHMCRRRRQIRQRILVKKPQSKDKKGVVVTDNEHWEYAPVFDAKFHRTERKVDMVRRRRWHRKMIPTQPGAPCFFNLGAEEQGEIDKKTAMAAPRMYLNYEKSHKWQLRAYVYQARNLLAADQNGFSDPYVRITFENQSQKTEIQMKSITPTWDQTLIYKEVEMYDDPIMVKDFPPTIAIELFDYDTLGEDEFLGRSETVPLVKLDPRDPRRSVLQWLNVYKGSDEAGEILVSFEIYLISDKELPPLPSRRGNLFMVPDGIRPMMQRTGVEILAWGLRNMKKFQLLKVSSPSVEIEIGGHVVNTEMIKNLKKTPNFSNPLLFMDVLLPKEELYMPPVNIKVRDHRAFGRKPIVGTYCLRETETFRCVALTHEHDNLDDYPELQDIISKVTSTVVSAAPQFESLIEGRKKADLKALDDDIDWWSKYYASFGNTEKCEKYLDLGYDTLTVYRKELEMSENFNHFTDFCKTFELMRGRNDEYDEDDEIESVGEFKGTFRIYPLPEDRNEKLPLKHFEAGLPTTGLIDCLIRVYIIKAYDLQPEDPNGMADPYIIINLGDTKMNSRDEYIPNSITPEFGKMFELKASLPQFKDLHIRVMDFDLMTKDDLIGETVIDIENRFLTKFRATCGLPQTYCIAGINQWRDSQKPSDILKDFCIKNRLVQPEYTENNCMKIGEKVFRLDQLEQGLKPLPQWGPPNERLALHVLNKLPFIKEHIEIRPLYNPLQPDIEQGKIEMWIDIHPIALGPPGPPFNIRPRKAKKFELRIVVRNTYDVKLDETSITGERMSDIYVKGWLNGTDERQETDVHYRSLDGEGNFNWRFVFPFDYIPSENVMVVNKKEHLWSLDTTETRMPCGLVLQVWDNDKFSPDDFLGTVEMELAAIPAPVKIKKFCTVEQLPQFGGTKTVNLFESRRALGYWPVYDNTSGKPELTGKLELEMELLVEDEITQRPAGRAREDPNENPRLDPPKRPETSFFWFTSPWKTFKFIVWKNLKYYIIGALVIILLGLLIALFIYSIPGQAARKMFGV